MNKYDLVSISTGDLLRRHISERTDLGREAETIVARGDLIPDKIMLKVVTHELDGLRDKVGLEFTAVFEGVWMIDSCISRIGFWMVSLELLDKENS